jgi:1,2-diacylglycerol 3-beta-glucosyltransferase
MGGVSELRGNGQLLLRQAVDAAGVFNEDTVTDDLDLSFRLLLDGQPVGSLWDPPRPRGSQFSGLESGQHK